MRTGRLTIIVFDIWDPYFQPGHYEQQPYRPETRVVPIEREEDEEIDQIESEIQSPGFSQV